MLLRNTILRLTCTHTHTHINTNIHTNTYNTCAHTRLIVLMCLTYSVFHKRKLRVGPSLHTLISGCLEESERGIQTDAQSLSLSLSLSLYLSLSVSLSLLSLSVSCTSAQRSARGFSMLWKVLRGWGSGRGSPPLPFLQSVISMLP